MPDFLTAEYALTPELRDQIPVRVMFTWDER
jgi:hypothetical protein